jgi:hypothetical protein
MSSYMPESFCFFRSLPLAQHLESHLEHLYHGYADNHVNCNLQPSAPATHPFKQSDYFRIGVRQSLAKTPPAVR